MDASITEFLLEINSLTSNLVSLIKIKESSKDDLPVLEKTILDINFSVEKLSNKLTHISNIFSRITYNNENGLVLYQKFLVCILSKMIFEILRTSNNLDVRYLVNNLFNIPDSGIDENLKNLNTIFLKIFMEMNKDSTQE